MNDLVHEWVEKAEGDYRVALRESRVSDQPAWDAVCFHAQQCIEKYAKAFLQAHGVEFERTHDYPGDSAAEEDARSAVEIASHVRAFIRAKLGLAA